MYAGHLYTIQPQLLHVLTLFIYFMEGQGIFTKAFITMYPSVSYQVF